MIVRVGEGMWLPYTSIRDITEQGPMFVSPKSWGPHVQIVLISSDIIRVEGVSAAEVADDINRQIVGAHRRYGDTLPVEP